MEKKYPQIYRSFKDAEGTERRIDEVFKFLNEEFMRVKDREQENASGETDEVRPKLL